MFRILDPGIHRSAGHDPSGDRLKVMRPGWVLRTSLHILIRIGVLVRHHFILRCDIRRRGPPCTSGLVSQTGLLTNTMGPVLGGALAGAALILLHPSSHTRTTELFHSSRSHYSSHHSIFTCTEVLPRSSAADAIHERLLPTESFGNRLSVSGESLGTGDDQTPRLMRGTDPSLELAYGEFPFQSLDALVDTAMEHWDAADHPPREISFLDLGSGAGRLCLYIALTRPAWRVHGIEIVPSLHQLALEASQTAVNLGLLQHGPKEDVFYGPAQSMSTIHFALGPAQDLTEVLKSADIIFCYSTVWRTNGFSTETGAMLLAREWMEILQHCRPGTLLITTDRSADPAFGWKLLKTLEVENREVCGSTGYVQLLEQRSEREDNSGTLD